MTLRNRWGVGIASLLVVGLASSYAGKQDQPGVPSIREGEIPVGYFGLPMGTSLTIEGMAVHKVMMRAGTTIQVDTVNGKRLPTPFEVVVENIYPPNLQGAPSLAVQSLSC
jgi:hypothetical protein